MNRLPLLFFLFVGFHSFAKASENALTLDYSIDSVEINPSISEGISKVIVRVNNSKFSSGDQILYGYQENSLNAELDDNNTFEFELKSGEYTFQFYPFEKRGFREIATALTAVISQTTTYITLGFNLEFVESEMVRKPVIYLYPTEETAVSLSVKTVGELSFTYPKYDKKWDFKASPNGDLTFGDKTYNYLFWEAEQNIDRNKLREIVSTKVLKEDLVEFLEKSLDHFGFNSKEKMDFITYWAPQMIQYKATEVRFIINEQCNQFADLEITPKPTNLLRFYIVWNKTDKTNTASSEVTLNFPKANRSGFTVLEWGGVEISTSPNLSLAETEK